MFTMNTVTLVTAKKRKRQYMRTYARAWEKVIMKIFTISFCSFFFAQLKQHFVLWKTTRRLMQNHTSFYEKPYVVLWKTTRRLMQNHTSVYEKPYVVLWKTTRRFMKNITSFYEKPHVVLCKTTRRFMKNHTSVFENKCSFVMTE